MAEALVFLVIKRISSFLAGEAIKALSSQLGIEISLLLEAESKIKQIESELKVMQAFLSQAELQETKNAALKAWLEQVKVVAYEIEDIIDDYEYFIGEQHSGAMGFLKNTIHKSKNVVSLHYISTRLTEIEIRLHKLSDMKYRYSIKMTAENSSSRIPCEQQHNLAASTYLMDQDELVGIGEEKEKLFRWLINDKSSRSVITVWGMGGLGKTTLVHNVYNSETTKRHFAFLAWITVSQKYHVEDVLRRMVKETYNKKEVIEVDIESMSIASMIDMLRRKLQMRSYLIVLDDVWSRDAWLGLDGALFENNCGSRVVITTRIKAVASIATRGCDLELQCLKENEAWDLFCRRVFRNEDRSYSKTLEHWGRKIVQKCQGLPLAIVCIGSLLSFRVEEESEWRNLYEQLNLELTSNPENSELSWLASVLNVSYVYLPSYLKNCFLYCSIFPEDCLIHRKRLIRLWVAEGFIERRTTQRREDVAEAYLNDLIQRCMLQVVGKNDFGRVRTCRMHDLVRELSISASRAEKFSAVCNKSEDVEELENEACRLSVHEFDGDGNVSMDMTHLRSLISFDTSSSLTSRLPSVLSSSRYLRVLDLQGAPIERVPDEVTKLFNLYHLGLRGTRVKELPKSLGRLRNLQQLDLTDTEVERLPHSITKLKKLRHLFAEKFTPYRIYHRRIGVEAPKELWNLKDLQTLKSIEASTSLVGKLGNLTRLRSFRIVKVRGIHSTQLCASILKMQSLSSLDIRASDENEMLQLKDLNSPPPLLQKLSLRGRLPEGLNSPLFRALGGNLRGLYLGWSGLREDPLPSLSHLSNLAFLWLEKAYDGQQLWFRTQWFPKLKTLILRDMEALNCVKMEEGAMEILNVLSLVDLQNLKEVPQGIEFLTSLQNLYLVRMPNEFYWGIEGRDQNRVQHIPHISSWS